jgi:AraC-like DNA-binding protein
MQNHYKIRGGFGCNGCTLTDTEKEKLEAYIRNNVGEKLRLFDLCTLIGACESGLIRKVKATYALTPHCLIEQLRVEKSRELLRHSKLSIAEIAYATGFTHQSRFGQVFRKYEEMTPSEFRAMRKPSRIFTSQSDSLRHRC